MRRYRVALVCTGAILVASAAAAQDPYSEFRIPEARSFTWLVSGSARWMRQYGTDPVISGSREERSSVGALSTFAHRHAESEPMISDLFFQARGNWQSTRSEDHSVFGSENFAGDLDDYRADVSAATTRYLGGSAWGVDAAASLSYSYARSGFGNTMSTFTGADESRTSLNTVNHYYTGEANLLLGPGYGRVRDVTGVFDMQVLEERLAETGRLAHPISPAARQRLAELFSVSGDFSAAHDRPSRYFWREVERLLREDGAITDGSFDAWSLMRALEPATLSVSITRLAGWRVSAAYVLALDRGHADASTDFQQWSFSPGVPPSAVGSAFSSRRSVDDNHGIAQALVAYHRPIGMRWQVDLSSAGGYGDGPHRRATLSSALALTNVLADRWVATATVTQFASSEVVDSVRLSPAWQIHGTAQLSYFFEDSWSISAGIDHTQARPVTIISGVAATPNGYIRNTQIFLGLTYRPVGRFEAPGLHVAERLTPGGI